MPGVTGGAQLASAGGAHRQEDATVAKPPTPAARGVKPAQMRKMCGHNRFCVFKSKAGFSSNVQVEKGLVGWNGCISVGLAVLDYK